MKIEKKKTERKRISMKVHLNGQPEGTQDHHGLKLLGMFERGFLDSVS